jgi:Flp pilus assembly protein CpaB
MERKAILISAVLSLVAMYIVYSYISTENAKLEDDYGKFFPIVVSTRDILQYETIRPTDVEVIRIPKALLPEGNIADPNDLIDSIAAVPITKGEHLLDNKVISKNVYSGLDTQIAQGRRAMSIPVNRNWRTTTASFSQL